METDFSLILSLWKEYNYASKQLINAMGGTSNEVGEFAEILTAKYYNAKQLNASTESADLQTIDGKLIQVKSRKMDVLKSTSLNVIRSWNFDLLVVVLFSKEGDILKVIELKADIA